MIKINIRLKKKLLIFYGNTISNLSCTRSVKTNFSLRIWLKNIPISICNNTLCWKIKK